MSTRKGIDRICVVAVVLSLLLTLLFMNGKALGLQSTGRTAGYEDRLFDASRVHTIDIVIDDWDGFLETCQSEEYSVCSVVIDGESYKNVGIRGKGNTSLSSVAQMGSSRYSFKVEFDQYDSMKSYHGLDKLSLNNLIQDNTMMKDYLTYQMMNAFGVASPLSSFVYLTVNGEDWGLYLAVEAVEEAFLQRNCGSDYGELYKPDSMSFGGGRGNGRDFDFNDFADRFGGENTDRQAGLPNQEGQTGTASDNFTPPAAPGDGESDHGGEAFSGTQDGGQRPSGAPPAGGDFSGFDPSSLPGGGDFSFGGASDVKLQYIDDDPDSYANIFDSAKTDLTDGDRARLIASLKSLSACEDLENVLDMDAVLRYFVVHNFVVNGDSYTGGMIHNYYLYEEDGRLSMIPWDYNLAFGTFQGQDAAGAVNEAVDDVLSDRPMQSWIFSDESYTQRYHALYAAFLDTVDVDQMIDSAYALIADYVAKDPTKFCTYEEFEAGVQALRSFCALRQESVRGQLDGTVPSTSEGQREQSSALVSAEGLDLSDMGTMNQGGMGGWVADAQPPQGSFRPGEQWDSAGFSPPGEQGGSAGFSLPGEQGGGVGFSPPGEQGNSADASPPEEQGDSADASPPEEQGDSSGFSPPGKQEDGTGFSLSEGFTPPGGQTDAAARTPAALLLGASVSLLLIGLLIAFKFK